MLLLAKGHYQATLGWIMGPLLRLWRWFTAPFRKSPTPSNQIDAKVIPMAQTSASTSSETTSPTEAESNMEIPEDVQQPAMYIYNLSRSQWANRLNLEWIYLDVMERGEESFQLLVNTVPEEPIQGYAQEMETCSEALKELIRERNKESLDGLNQPMNPCGELILFCAGNQLNELMFNHLGEKRLLFAGGSKRFYRDLSNLNLEFYFCVDETQRFQTVNDLVGNNAEMYLLEFLEIDSSLRTRLNMEIPSQDISRKIRCSLTLRADLGQCQKPLDCVRKIARSVRQILNKFSHFVHDLRIQIAIDLRNIPENITREQISDRFQSYNTFRSLFKSIGEMSMNMSNGEVLNLIQRTDLESSNDQTIVIASVSENQQRPTFHYHFDSRNIERSIFQILILLYVGEVKLHLPSNFVDRFISWFDLVEEEGVERIILNNLSGRELRELWESGSLGSSLLCSDLYADLHGDQLLKALTLSHNFLQKRNVGRTPPHLQNWPDFQLGRKDPIEHEFTTGHHGMHRSTVEFLEELLPAALSFLIHDYEGDDTFYGFEPEKVREEGHKHLETYVATPDATCLKINSEGYPSDFYSLDITFGGGRTQTQKNASKLLKYQPTEFGKSFVSKTIIVILSLSRDSAESICRRLISFDNYEKLLILNASDCPSKFTISSNDLAPHLLLLMQHDVAAVEFNVQTKGTRIIPKNSV